MQQMRETTMSMRERVKAVLEWTCLTSGRKSSECFSHISHVVSLLSSCCDALPHVTKPCQDHKELHIEQAASGDNVGNMLLMCARDT